MQHTSKHGSKIQFDLQGITRLLTYGRILEPASKIVTMHNNNRYFIPPVKSSNDDNVYDTLDLIYENRRKIIQRMNSRITAGISRNTDNVFYDVTNFFFEIEHPDVDELDEDGNVLHKGLRKMGVSKENRKQPIVQMGLFLDDNGIPISIEMFPGNTLDHLTLREAMRQTVDTLGLDRFILVVDRGMYSGTNMCHVIDQGDGYIVSKSLKKTKAQSRSLRKFLKKDMINKQTGEVPDSRKLLAMIDDDKLKQFNELMGYYQIVSSELSMDDLQIIEKYHGLTKIEDQFREMKGTLQTRPVYVSSPEHIKAHLMVCFIALTMILSKF